MESAVGTSLCRRPKRDTHHFDVRNGTPIISRPKDEQGHVSGYQLRQEDPKGACVRAFHSLNYRIIDAGDSYNDISMLQEADVGILFRAPEHVVAEFPQFKLVRSYAELKASITGASERDVG